MSYSWQIALLVIVTALCGAFTGMLVPLRQLFSDIDPQYFKRIRVAFPAFLFVGAGGRKAAKGNVREYGIIVPMFVLHLTGYLFTIAICVLIPVLDQFVGLDPLELIAVPLGIALLHTLIVVITEAICVRTSRRRAAQAADDAPAE